MGKPIQFLLAEAEEVLQVVLASDVLVGELVPQLVEILLSQHLHCLCSSVRVIDHYPVDYSQQALICLGKNLNKGVFTVLQSVFLMGGSLQSLIQQSGFMASTSSSVGVPITLMISSRWLMLVSPMKSGSPLSSSRMTQPADQISTTVVYLVAPKISSGARQHLAQIQEILDSLACSCFAEPKSQITAELPLSRMFSGFISRWHTSRECKQESPLKIWYRMIFVQRLLILVSLQKLMRVYRFSSQQRMVMFRYQCPPSQVMQLPSTSTMKSFFSIFTISISLFLYRESCTTRFIAIIYPVFRNRPRKTLPKVPSPTKSMSQMSSLPMQEGAVSWLSQVGILLVFFFDFLWLLPSLLLSWLFFCLRSGRQIITDQMCFILDGDFKKYCSGFCFSFFNGRLSFLLTFVRGSYQVTSFLDVNLLTSGECILFFSVFLICVEELFFASSWLLFFFSSFLGLGWLLKSWLYLAASSLLMTRSQISVGNLLEVSFLGFLLFLFGSLLRFLLFFFSALLSLGCVQRLSSDLQCLNFYRCFDVDIINLNDYQLPVELTQSR